ncbi:hypothetical protein G7046_g2289 [Stylonectria norvegica]|nr:hypothetical protein G7046_g2289 [Stylonectria norvegica]
MEHLALLDNSISLLELRVPFVAEDYVADGEFQLYGRYRGYASIQEVIGLHAQQPDDFDCLVQTWLFFGLLRQFFGPELDLGSFVSEDEFGPRINTKHMREHCDNCLRTVPRPNEQQLANARFSSIDEPYDLLDILDADTQHTARVYRGFLREQAACLVFCAELCDKLDESIQCAWDTDSRRILLSVKLLVEALRTCFDHAVDLFQPLWLVCCIVQNFYPEVLFTPPVVPRPGVFLENFLLHKKNWCPSRLSAISSATPAQSLFLFTGYRAQDLIGIGHIECTQDKCHVDAIVDDSAEHAAACPGDDSCNLISVPVQELIDIYKQGHIPLLSSIISASGQVNVRVVPSQMDLPFTTISHVWSDGLKNDHGNALYECQLLGVHQALRRFSRYANARPDVPTIPLTSSGQWFYMIQPQVLIAHTATKLPPLEPLPAADGPSEGETAEVFWLDVLCIPRGRTPDEYLDERRQAIGKIDWTFASAERVLVRDRVLQSLVTDSMPGLQLAAHICSSRWLSRCWTLAEGALAWDWAIQFADRTMRFSEILSMAEASYDGELVMRGQFRAASVAGYDVLLQRRLQTGLLATVRRIPYDRTYTSQTKRQFAANWNSLLARATSWKQDRLLILGLLVKLSILDLVELDKSLRMKAILNPLSEIPAAFLFNASPKIQNEPRNRWIPTEIGSGDWLTPTPTIKTYTEGRMVGPLEGRKHASYKLGAVTSDTFAILDDCFYDDETQLAKFHITLRDPPTLPVGQDIILVLPIRLENNGKYLVRWQCLADVNRINGSELTEHMDMVQCTRLCHSASIYVECDMTDWPSPRPLSAYLSPDQNKFWIVQLFELPNHPKQMCWTVAVAVALHAGILAIAVTDSIVAHAIGGFLLAFSAIGGIFLGMFSHSLTPGSSPMGSWRGRPEYGGREAFDEYKGTAQQEWAELFRSEQDKMSSARYNFLKWAQRLPSSRRYMPKPEGHVSTAARVAEWFAMTNRLLRAMQFVTTLFITGLDATLPGQLESGVSTNEHTDAASKAEWVDIFLIPFWFGAWTALAKWAATDRAQAGIVGILTALDAFLLYILCCLVAIETAFYNIRDSTFVKHPEHLDLIINTPTYLEDNDNNYNILGAQHLGGGTLGGIASTTDKLETLQFIVEELQAITTANSNSKDALATVYCYTVEGIRHAIAGGVRGIEHGNMVDHETAQLMSERNVPNIDFGVAYFCLHKNAIVRDAGIRGIQHAEDTGVTVFYGNGTTGPTLVMQTYKFVVRSKIFDSSVVLRQATINGAQQVGTEGKLGELVEGSFAHLLFLGETPLEDVTSLDRLNESLMTVMKDGRIVESRMDGLV